MERRRLVHIFQFGDVSDGRNGFATDECYWVGGYVALIGSNLTGRQVYYLFKILSEAPEPRIKSKC